ncbi:hypothetical protein NOVO_07645 [Rickettsiales bacterium Ac37b]|nr:hypothetical protein NOVO_07645 [Rickettsiales bacterium Ac37b]
MENLIISREVKLNGIEEIINYLYREAGLNDIVLPALPITSLETDENNFIYVKKILELLQDMGMISIVMELNGRFKISPDVEECIFLYEDLGHMQSLIYKKMTNDPTIRHLFENEFFKIKLAWIDSERLIQKNLENQTLDQKLLEILFGKHAQDVLYTFYYYSSVDQNKTSKLCDIFNIIINEYNNGNLKLANNTALLLTIYIGEIEKRKNTISPELKEQYLSRIVEIDEKIMDKIAEELDTLLYKSISGVEAARENFAIDKFAYQKNILQNKLSFQERVKSSREGNDISFIRYS